MAFQVEHTDTFGGEANYCWVNRYTLEPPANLEGAKLDRWLVRQAKAVTGLTGVRAVVSNYGDMLEIRPRGICQVVFVNWLDQ